MGCTHNNLFRCRFLQRRRKSHIAIILLRSITYKHLQSTKFCISPCGVKTYDLTVKNRPATYRTVKTVVCESSVSPTSTIVYFQNIYSKIVYAVTSRLNQEDDMPFVRT
jgi:hypothetical protein